MEPRPSRRSKPSASFSFAVGSRHGERSGCWIVSGAAGEIYVTNASLGPLFHVSLHKSGAWHIKGDQRKTKDRAAKIIESHESQISDTHYKIGLIIAIPDSCLRKAFQPDNPAKTRVPDMWLDRPPYGGVVEVAFCKWDMRKIHEDWPGQSAGAVPLQIMRTSEYEAFGVFYRALPADDPFSQNVADSLKWHKKPRPMVLNSPGRRGYLSTTNENGSLVVVEDAID